MKLKQAIAIIVFTALMLTSGCAALLEGDRYSESLFNIPEYVPEEDPPEERIEIADYDELIAAMMDMITEHESSGQLVNTSFDEEALQGMVDRAANEIMTYHPIGAYAVSGIAGMVVREQSYNEIDISIEYKRTKEQVGSIVNVSTIRYLRTELLSIMSDYREEAVFRSMLDITEDNIRDYAREIYYENPRYILMLPVIAFEAFPPEGDDRIIELRFAHIEQTSILLQYGSSLTTHVRGNAGLAAGMNDGETLLSLVENLMASVSFDEHAARSISEHGAQNFAATAFGALVRQNAVGEGFAMAFKALCDELGFECRVVLGYFDQMVHAWNIVSLFGEYYFIDVAMGTLNGVESSFLKTDEDFLELQYVWDFDNTVRCNGALTYEDILFADEDNQTIGSGRPGSGFNTGANGGANGETDDETDDEPDDESDDEENGGTDEETDDETDEKDDGEDEL